MLSLNFLNIFFANFKFVFIKRFFVQLDGCSKSVYIDFFVFQPQVMGDLTDQVDV